MKFSGIDLHSNNSVVVVSDEEDRMVVRERVPNELTRILRCLRRIVRNWRVWWLNRRSTGIGWWMG